MAFVGVIAGQVLRSALGVIGRYGNDMNEGEITRHVMSSVTLSVPGRYQEYQGIVRQAVRLSRAGTDATFGDVSAREAARVPTDPSIRPTGARFRYRAVVEVTNPSGQTTQGQLLFDSDTPMTHRMIQAEVESDTETRTSEVRTARRSIAQLGPGDTVSVIIISAGQRAR